MSTTQPETVPSTQHPTLASSVAATAQSTAAVTAARTSSPTSTSQPTTAATLGPDDAQCPVPQVESTLRLSGAACVDVDGGGSRWLPSFHFTWEAWVMAESGGQDSVLFDAESTETASALGGWNVQLEDGVPKVFLVTYSDEFTVSAQNPLPVGEWAHVAVVKGENGVTIYVNGQVAAQHDARDSTVYYTSVSGDNAVHIGCYTHNTVPAERFLQGRVSDVRVWQTERQQADILADMRTPLSSVSDSNLLAYWPLNEDLADSTPNNHHGVSTGGAELRLCGPVTLGPTASWTPVPTGPVTAAPSGLSTNASTPSPSATVSTPMTTPGATAVPAPVFSPLCQQQSHDTVFSPDFEEVRVTFEELNQECLSDVDGGDMDCDTGLQEFTQQCQALGAHFDVCATSVTFATSSAPQRVLRRQFFCQPPSCHNLHDRALYDQWLDAADPHCSVSAMKDECEYQSACAALDLPVSEQLLQQVQGAWTGALHHSHEDTGECVADVDTVFAFDGQALTITQTEDDVVHTIFRGDVIQLEQHEGFAQLRFSDEHGPSNRGEMCTTIRVDHPNELDGSPRLAINWDRGSLDDGTFGVQCPYFPEHLNYYHPDELFCGLGGKGRSVFSSPASLPDPSDDGGMKAGMIVLIVAVCLLVLAMAVLAYRYLVTKKQNKEYVQNLLLPDSGLYESINEGSTVKGAVHDL